jgi:hypothetical protein
LAQSDSKEALKRANSQRSIPTPKGRGRTKSDDSFLSDVDKDAIKKVTDYKLEPITHETHLEFNKAKGSMFADYGRLDKQEVEQYEGRIAFVECYEI